MVFDIPIVPERRKARGAASNSTGRFDLALSGSATDLSADAERLDNMRPYQLDWVRLHPQSYPLGQEETPFVLAIVDLAEGPRMMTNIVDCDPESVTIGMAVEVCFDDVTDEVTLPKFRPAG